MKNESRTKKQQDDGGRYRLLLENANEAMLVAQDGRLKMVNRKFEDIIGYSTQELIERPFTEFIHSDDRELVLERHRKRLNGELEPVEIYYFRIIKKDGTQRWIELKTSVSSWENRPATINFLNDVTERRRLEEELRRSEARYCNIFNNAAASLWEEDLSGVRAAIIDLKNNGTTDFRKYFEEHPDFVQRASQLVKIVDVNEVTLKLYGAKDKAELLCSLDRVFTPESYDTFKEELLAIAEGKTYFEAESINRTLQGKRLNILIRLTIPDEDSAFSNLLVSIFDITAYKSMEEMLLRAKEFEALGLFAGGLVHDFNNLLAVILSNVELAEMSVPTGDPEDKMYKRLAAAKKAAMRVIELTEQLLVFAGGKTVTRETAPVTEFIKETASLVMRGSDNRCKYFVPDDLWPVAYDEEQLKRVIRNIVTNAGEAMPGGGLLKVSAENIRLDRGNSLSLKEGAYVKVSFEDDGIGIDEKHIANIFDPYFTTKGMGREKGRGLGLAVCYSIMQKHEGAITVKSEQGVGTTFSLYLPAAVSSNSHELNLP